MEAVAGYESGAYAQVGILGESVVVPRAGESDGEYLTPGREGSRSLRLR